VTPETTPGLGAIAVAQDEPILRAPDGEISILVARDDITITRARYAAGQSIAGRHVHAHHTDAFYVLEGKLIFQIGRERETVTVSRGGFVAVPPGVAHALRVTPEQPACWLTIHTPDGGFAAFMRGICDNVAVAWDIDPVPVDGGGPASDATVAHAI